MRKKMKSRLLFKHARELIQNGNFDEAAVLLDELTAAHPRAAAYRYHKVLVEFKARNEEELALFGERIYESENFITACRLAGVIGTPAKETFQAADDTADIFGIDETTARETTDDTNVTFSDRGTIIDESGNIVLKNIAADTENSPENTETAVPNTTYKPEYTNPSEFTESSRENQPENTNVIFSDSGTIIDESGNIVLKAPAPDTEFSRENTETALQNTAYQTEYSNPSEFTENSRENLTDDARETAAKIRSLEERINLAFPHLNLSVQNLVLPADSDEQHAIESGGTMAYVPESSRDNAIAGAREVTAKTHMDKVDNRVEPPPAVKTYRTLTGNIIVIITILIAAITAAAVIPLHSVDVISKLKELPVHEQISDSTIGEVFGKQLTNAKYTHSGGTLLSKLTEHDSGVYVDISGKISGYDYEIRFRCGYENDKDVKDGDYKNLFARIGDSISPGGYVPYIEHGRFNGHTLDSDSAYTLLVCLLMTYAHNTDDPIAFLTEYFNFNADDPLEFTSRIHFEARNTTVDDIINQKYRELERTRK